MKKATVCSAGYRQDKKSRRCVFLKNAGYNSHGHWATLKDMQETELERGNPFPSTNHNPNTPAIWITFSKRDALRYAVLADRWDDIGEGKPLTEDEKDILKYGLEKISLKKTDKIITEDGDGGYLLIRP